MSLSHVGLHTFPVRTRLGVGGLRNNDSISRAVFARGLFQKSKSEPRQKSSMINALARSGTLVASSFGRRYSSGSFDGGGFYRGGGKSVMNAYWAYLAVNAAVFGYWQYATAKGDRKTQAYMLENFVVSPASVDEGRWWTLLTSAFMHTDLTHFAFNMLTANTMCKILAICPGMTGPHLLAIAVGSSVFSSCAWVVSQKSKMAENFGMSRLTNYKRSAIGASGGVMGLAAVATCFLPTLPINLFLIPIGIPLWIITISYGIFDAYQLDSTTSRVAHAGHLGGLAFGTSLYLVGFHRLAPFGIWYRRFPRW